ncbi:hypothetical protein SHL15_6757 [Streptomyces hygroscopicus subsp. limoneus]|nr:hypothetical protein SHL15_6757 [Streptomyces hygroscopicus subsp. limoneus]
MQVGYVAARGRQGKVVVVSSTKLWSLAAGCLALLLVGCDEAGTTAHPRAGESRPHPVTTARATGSSSYTPTGVATVSPTPTRKKPTPNWGNQSGPRFVTEMGDQRTRPAPKLPVLGQPAGARIEVSGGWTAGLRVTATGAQARVKCQSRPYGGSQRVWTYTVTSQPGLSEFGLPRQGMFFQIERVSAEHGGGWETSVSGTWQSTEDVHFSWSEGSNSDGFDGAASRPTTIRLRESADHRRVSFAAASVAVADFTYTQPVAGINVLGTVVCPR